MMPVAFALAILLVGAVVGLAAVPWLRQATPDGVDPGVVAEEVVEEELRRRFCPWCGHAYDHPGDRVCPACGQDRDGGQV